MEPMPVCKRTRHQRAMQEKRLRDRCRQARLEARERYRKEICVVSSEDGDDDEAVKVVDAEEYNRRVHGVNINANGFNENGVENVVIMDGNYDSDESLQVLGERWNPMILGEYDDVDEDSDDENDEVVKGGTGNGNGNGDDGSQHSSRDDIGLTSSEDDSDKDRDFKVGEGEKDTSSEVSSSTDEEDSDDSNYGEEVFGGERKKRPRFEGESELEAKERRTRKRTERREEKRVRDGSKPRERKKKERVSKKEEFYGLISSGDDENGVEKGGDFGGEKRIKSGSRRYVKIKKGSDDNVGGETGFIKSKSGHSVKVRKGSDGVYRKVVSLGENDDGNVVGEMGFSVKKKSKKGPSSSRDGKTGSKKSDKKHYVKSKKTRKALSSDEEDGGKDSGHDDEAPKKKTVRKDRVDEEEGESSERKATARKLSNRKNKEKSTKRHNTLLATILEDEKGEVEETMPREYVHLPLKFWFPPKKVAEPESSEATELEDLFKEMEFGLQACHIGSDDSASKDNMEVDPPVSAISGNKLCAGGNHHLIHDEEIGIYCRFCSYVMLESKFVTSEFDDNIFGNAGRKEARRAQADEKNRVESHILDFSEDGKEGYEPSKVIQGTVWELIPGTWATLYPHQREGFEFIWTNVSGGININELDRPTQNGIGGCIICHAPGTGKTRLAIVFIQSFLKKYPMSRPVIIAPRTMLRTWQEEFLRWKVEVPFFNLNEDEVSGKEDPDLIIQLDKHRDKNSIRLVKIGTWLKGKGILGISYGLYEKLANERHKMTNKYIREALLNKPGLLVLDEGHTPRNDKSNIWKVLKEVKTMKKVILSGTPFQNNFDELGNILSLVRRKEFDVPMKAGSFVQDEKKIEEFSSKIRPFVHVHKGEILKETLKGLFATLIVLKPSELQERCFAGLVGNSNFALDHLVSVASVHPSIFCDQKLKPSFIDKDFFDSLESHKEDLDAGVKTRFLFELIKLSHGERVLVFGQYLPPLNFLAGLIKTRFHWEMGRELLYMDGKQDTKERQNTIRLFNDANSEARVLLASTKACSEGIHLVGASRVVLLDVVWNPSVERQAISRAYRLGQKKDVFVYHLITAGTLEEQKYKRQATKERLSELVFSSKDGKCVQKSVSGSRNFVDQVLEAMLDHQKLEAMFHKIVYQPKADNLIESFGPLNL